MNKQNTILALSIAVAQLLTSPVKAANNDFYESILITDEIKKQKQNESAQKSAAEILDAKPQTLKSEIQQLNRRNYEIDQLQENYGVAPFGLIWGMSMEDAKKQGIKLNPTQLKDYMNCFNAESLPKSLDGFQRVTLIFGEDNRLWRVLAYGDFVKKDTAAAAKVMKIYLRYYNLLKQKYGNAHQSYTALATNVDESLPPLSNADPESNPNLLKELANGNAELYATFEGADVGAALSVNVDGDLQSYIVIDYKNLKILKQNDAKILQAL